jgi:electron transport complex protein RnfC
MKNASFSGGLKLPAPSESGPMPIESMPLPDRVIIPLKQHRGPACTPQVKKKDELKSGDIIGESVTTSFRTPLSGVVTDVDKNFSLPSGERVTAVSIEKGEQAEETVKLPEGLQPMGLILQSGLNDFSPQAMPLLDKITMAQERKIQTLIVSGLDELTQMGTRSALMAHSPGEVLAGTALLQQLMGVQEVILGVYEQNREALEALSQSEHGFRIAALKARHPQHKNQLLVSVLTGEEYPAGSTPEDLGIVIVSAETAYALSQVVNHGQPWMSKLVTLAGSPFDPPRNLLVPLGTTIRDMLEYAGADLTTVGKLILGGPLTGQALYSFDFPVTRETDLIVVQDQGEVIDYACNVCVKCGYCVQACPMRLMPLLISGYSEGGHFDLAEKNDIFSCIECGCCAYVCPASIPMVQWIQYGKAEITAMKEHA